MTTDDAKGPSEEQKPCACCGAGPHNMCVIYWGGLVLCESCRIENRLYSRSDLDHELQSLRAQLSAAMSQLGERAREMGLLRADISAKDGYLKDAVREAERRGAERMLELFTKRVGFPAFDIWAEWEKQREGG